MTFLCHKSHEGHEVNESHEGHEGHEGHEDISAYLHFSAFWRHRDNDNEKNVTTKTMIMNSRVGVTRMSQMARKRGNG